MWTEIFINYYVKEAFIWRLHVVIMLVIGTIFKFLSIDKISKILERTNLQKRLDCQFIMFGK
jgi:hypothetical protein